MDAKRKPVPAVSEALISCNDLFSRSKAGMRRGLLRGFINPNTIEISASATM